MGQNYFTDFPDRVRQVKENKQLPKLIPLFEEVRGETDFYQSTDEAIEICLTTLEEVGKFCAQEVRPAAEEIDRIGIEFKDGKVTYPEKLTQILKRCAELGLFSGTVSRAYGGMNLPSAPLSIALEMFGQACPNTALAIAAFSMSPWIEQFGTEEQKQLLLPKIITNEAHTSMALTEPGAGSDLGKLRTTAVREGDHYIVNGAKRFISYGNSDYTFALVRTDPKSEGLQGLSVLLVPRDIPGKENANFSIPKIEDKICLHASPTCEMIFENSVGYLFGSEGDGFKVMAQLMNMARTAMASISVGICTAALDEAKTYGLNRMTMGKPIAKHPMVADMLFEMEMEIRAMRSMVVEASSAMDWCDIYRLKEDKSNLKRWQKRYRRLTPLIKYYCAEKCVTMTKNAVQIFGGYGVCKEYPVERLFRESIIYPIYEGTSQIQSLMVLKDTLKDVALNAPGFLGSLAGAWAESKVTRDPMKNVLLQARNELNQSIRTVMMSIVKGKFKTDIDALKEKKIQQFLSDFSMNLLTPETDLTLPFLYAERMTRIVCDYYALKCLVDEHHEGDKEGQNWILNFAALALPRMKMENEYMLNRLPSTLDYIDSLPVEEESSAGHRGQAQSA